MSLTVLSSKLGKKKRKTVGRGNGSGHGTYSCRGGKGQTARTGGTIPAGFAGGQTPFMRKMPKIRGFKNPNHQEYQVVNLEDLNVFDDNTEVKLENLLSKNLVSKKNKPVKLLANGELTKTLTITVNRASAKAITAVEAKKGKINLLEKPAQNA